VEIVPDEMAVTPDSHFVRDYPNEVVGVTLAGMWGIGAAARRILGSQWDSA